MPVFPSQNLNTQKICESYPRLLQIYSGSLVLDGTGSLKTFLNVTSNYSISSSYALNFGNSITQSFTSSNVWSFNHNLGSKYVIIQTVDTNDNQLIPDVINLFDDNTAIIGFSVPTAGTALATRGGVRIFSSSYGYYNLNTGSTYPITSSWAINALNGGTKLYTGSYYPITSSWARNAVTASYVISGGSGTSGTAGSSGTSGTTGSSGTSGQTGSSGSSGTSGTSGTSGQNGSSGTSGSSGSSGTAGSSGTSGTSGTSGVNGISGGAIYYFNESVTQTPYKELYTTPTAAAEQSVTVTIANGVTATIQSYLTATNLPNVTAIPGGIWSFFLHTYKQNNNASFNIFCEVYSRTSGGTETLLFTTDPALVTSNSPNPSMVTTDVYQSGYSLNLTDRILVKVCATNTSNQSHTITFVTEGTTHYSFAQTTLGVFSGTSGTSGTSGLLNLTGSTISGVITYNGSGGDVQSNVKVQSGYVILNQVSSSLNFVDDVAAATAGVPKGGLYRNGNFILIRIT
jgi:hypothetical protein